MQIEGPAKRLAIHIGEDDIWHGKPLYEAILELLRAEGCAGATVTRGIAGFGKSSRIHTTHLLRFSQDLPVVVELVDHAERIEAVLDKLEEMVGGGLITVSDVRVIKYSHGEAPGGDS